MSRYNRLSRPIGVLSTRDKFLQVCDVLELDPHNNDVVRHIHNPDTALEGEICRLLILGDTSLLGDAMTSFNTLKSLALTRVRNEARATKIDPRRQEVESY